MIAEYDANEQDENARKASFDNLIDKLSDWKYGRIFNKVNAQDSLA